MQTLDEFLIDGLGGGRQGQKNFSPAKIQFPLHSQLFFVVINDIMRTIQLPNCESGERAKGSKRERKESGKRNKSGVKGKAV